MGLSWRRLSLLLLAFGAWSAVGVYAFPHYAKVVVPATSALLEGVRPHGLDLSLRTEYPYLYWHFTQGASEPQSSHMSFTLQVYNTVLYLTLLTAWPGLSLRGRLVLAATGAPVVFLFQVLDLALAVEGRILSVVQPEHAASLREFSLWYSAVKFYNFLSIMAVKQVVFIGLFYLQWMTLPRWAPWVRSAR